MSYMIRGNDVESEDSNPFDGTPFTPTASLQSRSSDILNKYVLRGAERLYSELERTGTLDEVHTRWFDDCDGTGYESEPATFYYLEIGPITATAPGVTWNRAFTIDLDVAPAFKSDEWKAIAEGFDLSLRDADRGVPSMVTCAYNELEKATKRNDGVRAMHPQELRNYGPNVTDRAFDRALDCLAEFPGVNPPTDDGPVWVRGDRQAEATTTETEEGHV